MKKAAFAIIVIAALLVFSAQASAEAEAKDASCEDVGTFDLVGKAVCKIKSSVSGIGGWFQDLTASLLSWVMNPPISSTGIADLFNVFKWLAFTGAGLLVLDTGVRYIQASGDPAAAEVAKQQARNIIIMVIAIIASPVIVGWLLDLVRLVTELIIAAASDAGTLAAVLGAGIVAAFVASSPIFPISWTLIIVLLLSFVFAMLMRVFVLTAFVSMLPGILFLYFWERTSGIGRKMLSILAVNMFIPILWVTVFVVAANMPGGYKLLSPLLVVIAFPLNSYLYFNFGGLSASFLMPPSPIKAAGSALATAGSRARAAITASRAVKRETTEMMPYVREGSGMPAPSAFSRQRIAERKEGYSSAEEAPAQFVPTRAAAVYHFNASDLNFGSKNLSPQGRRLNRIYETDRSHQFLEFAASQDKSHNKAIRHMELAHTPHLTSSEKDRHHILAEKLYSRISAHKKDEVIDDFGKHEKLQASARKIGGETHARQHQRVQR